MIGKTYIVVQFNLLNREYRMAREPGTGDIIAFEFASDARKYAQRLEEYTPPTTINQVYEMELTPVKE